MVPVSTAENDLSIVQSFLTDFSVSLKLQPASMTCIIHFLIYNILSNGIMLQPFII